MATFDQIFPGALDDLWRPCLGSPDGSVRRCELSMKLLIATMFAAQATTPDCATLLTLHGLGATASRHVRAYVDCLNSTYGTSEHLRATCRDARAKATAYRGSKATRSKVDAAVRWLDAMVEERATCETGLKVGA